jgi:putative hydroxymethylpyrimidine transport system substrate-binding protein
MRRRDFMVGAAGASALATSGCQSRSSGRTTVILDWLLNANHAALFSALHSGAFARAGLDVRLLAPADPDSPPRLAAAGQADLAVSYGAQINMITAAGLPLVRIATLINRPLNSVAALGDGGVRTLADLKGKTVGFSVAGVEEALLDAMLRSAGLGAGDVTKVKVNYDMIAALMSHKLDAAIGAFRNAEVLDLQARGQNPIVFAPEDHGVPLYDELILVARSDRRGDPRLKRFVSALGEGGRALAKDPEAMWRAFAQANPVLATAVNHAAWTATISAIPQAPAALDVRRYLDFQSFALREGIIRSAAPIDRFAIDLTA